VRTFIAIDVNQEIRDTSEEVISKLQELGFKAAWTKPENVHLTLFSWEKWMKRLLIQWFTHLINV